MYKKLITLCVVLTLSLAGLTGFNRGEKLEAQPTYQTITIWNGSNIIHETAGNIDITIKPEYIKVTDKDTGSIKIIDADDITLIEQADVVEYK